MISETYLYYRIICCLSEIQINWASYIFSNNPTLDPPLVGESPPHICLPVDSYQGVNTGQGLPSPEATVSNLPF